MRGERGGPGLRASERRGALGDGVVLEFPAQAGQLLLDGFAFPAREEGDKVEADRVCTLAHGGVVEQLVHVVDPFDGEPAAARREAADLLEEADLGLGMETSEVLQ